MGDTPSLAERLEHGVDRCYHNRDEALLMTYNGASAHNVSTISVGDLRAAAVELRRLEAIVEAVGDIDQLRGLARFGLERRSHTDGHAYLRRIADAVEGTS